MVISSTVLIIAVLIIAIWFIIEFKRLRHKMFAIFLIVLILFTYISFSVVLKGANVDFKTSSGVIEAGKLYLVWLGSAFGNMKVLTANAIKMDWKSTNSTADA